MFFQRILKGISGDDDKQALRVLQESGILCRWWSRVEWISNPEIVARLDDRHLDWHLNHYDDPDPNYNNEPFHDHTPFISTTAGAIERDAMRQRNRIFSPFVTALMFATNDLTSTGFIFYGYVFTLGKKAVELRGFAEEVRDVYVYPGYMPYYREGEIVAKIDIPSPNLEKYEKYDGPQARIALSAGQIPVPTQVKMNPRYAAPERFSNIRGAVI